MLTRSSSECRLERRPFSPVSAQAGSVVNPMEFKDPPLPLRVGCFFPAVSCKRSFQKVPTGQIEQVSLPTNRASILFSQPTPPPEADSDCWAFPVDGNAISPSHGGGGGRIIVWLQEVSVVRTVEPLLQPASSLLFSSYPSLQPSLLPPADSSPLRLPLFTPSLRNSGRPKTCS